MSYVLRLIPNFTVMLDHVILDYALVFDIETVPGVKTFAELSPAMQELWQHKAERMGYLDKGATVAESYETWAGIYAEFGKIICISVGYFKKDAETGRLGLRIRSFANKDEKQLLLEFAETLNKYFNQIGNHYFSGHNINEFDIPYCCRRFLVNGIELPGLLDIAGKKPWELKNFDTMQHWKFGDYKSYTSLKLLAAIFDIPTPKDDIDGSDVARVYWQEDNLDRIRIYCEKDVATAARLLLRYKGMPTLEDSDIHFV